VWLLDTSFVTSLPAIRGIQAKQEYYVVMFPLKLIPRLLSESEEDYLPPEYRAQRIINKSRIPDIASYILNNPNDYCFSSITVSLDGDMEFIPFSNEPQYKDIGKLFISLDSKLLINDGQHRKAAIEEALKVSPELGDETISVVIFKDIGLKRAQQMFADLNRHAVNTTTSIGILYDHRDQLANITKQIVSDIPLLERYTDKEKVSLPKFSPRIFTLNQIFNTNSRLINKKKGQPISGQEQEFLRQFWTLLTDSINEWKLVMKKELSPVELRANYIVAHGIFLEAIGIVGGFLFQNYPSEWKTFVKKLTLVDWSKSNKESWMGRAFSPTGRINKNSQTIQLTANMIKMNLNLPLTSDELELEKFLQVGDV
jgi:DNA sulfur modification protein DndB